ARKTSMGRLLMRSASRRAASGSTHALSTPGMAQEQILHLSNPRSRSCARPGICNALTYYNRLLVLTAPPHVDGPDPPSANGIDTGSVCDHNVPTTGPTP